METKYREVPNGKIAAMIALHYLMLVTRGEYRTKPESIEEHIARALHWWKVATGDSCWDGPTVGQQDPANKDQ